VGPGCHTGSKFWKLYLIRTNLTLLELVSLVKSVFKLFKLEWIVLVFRVWTQYVDVQHLMYWQGQRVCDALFQTLERKRENENVLRIPKVGFF
jgi:hypothetical protein